MQRLLFSDWKVFRQSFERPNLSYSVFETHCRINKIIEILTKVPGCAIIYCKSRRREAKEISELLQLQNIQQFYHAVWHRKIEAANRKSGSPNKTRVIVCTNAFGMGIDKAHVVSLYMLTFLIVLKIITRKQAVLAGIENVGMLYLLYDEKEMKELEELPSLRLSIHGRYKKCLPGRSQL